MGLLDDAIRQHLDLKRQHGADPGEVAEKERQAFGPIKRGDLEVGAAPLDDAPLHEGEAELAPERTWAEDVPVPEPEASVSVVSELAPEPLEELAAVAEEPFVAPLDQPFAPSAEATAYAPVPEPAFEPPPAPPTSEPAHEPAPAPTPVESFQDIGEPTQEYSVLDDAPDPQPDAAPGEHDELEETPDFLEETPEHDRLWFEQKPPRDFDF